MLLRTVLGLKVFTLFLEFSIRYFHTSADHRELQLQKVSLEAEEELTSTSVHAAGTLSLSSGISWLSG